MKTIEARKHSHCNSCFSSISPGEYIHISPETGAFHLGCPPPSVRRNGRKGKCHICKITVLPGMGILKPIEGRPGRNRVYCSDCGIR